MASPIGTDIIEPGRGLNIPKNLIQGSACGDHKWIQIRDETTVDDVPTARTLQATVVPDGEIPIASWSSIMIGVSIAATTQFTAAFLDYEFTDIDKTNWHKPAPAVSVSSGLITHALIRHSFLVAVHNYVFTIQNPGAAFMRLFTDITTGTGVGSRVGLYVSRGWSTKDSGTVMVV